MDSATLRRHVLASPGACLILASRARLAGMKAGVKFTEALPAYASKKAKLYGALEAAERRNIRAILVLLEDEEADFRRARREDTCEDGIEDFVAAVIHNAESVVPGFCAEGAL